MRSIGFISCSFEEVVAFFFGEEIADVAGGFPELVAGAGSGFSDQCLEFGECHFDPLAGRRLPAIAVRRVEVGRIGGEEEQSCACGPDGIPEGGGLVAAEVVEVRRNRK